MSIAGERAEAESEARAVNERVDDCRGPRFEGLAPYLCECADRSCHERVLLTEAEYEHVRSDARLFAVLPGHEVPNDEIVVERTDRYEVVRKTGEAGAVAEDHDPRS
jgi:hypothetical protein